MDLPKSDSEDGFICSTPRKRHFSNIVTSTPTCTATNSIASEKRRKVFCTGSPNWDEAPDSYGFDSFEDDSPKRTPKQNSFELTCNELKLVNSVVQETELLIKEIDTKLNPEANTVLIQEKKEILKEELSQLLQEKNILENSVKSQAALYDAVHVIDDSFLNDTVLSNYNSTLKNVVDGNEKGVLDGTIISISDNLINFDPHYISSTENTIICDDAENIINHSVQNDTVLSNLNSTLKNLVEGNDKSVLDGTIINISDLSTENTIICNDAATSPKEKENKNLKEILSISVQSKLQKAQSTTGKLSTASKSTQTDLSFLKSNSMKKSIDFDNSIIIINNNVIHKFDEITSELKYDSKIRGKHVDIMKKFHEKLQSMCVVISSLHGKHNSSENIKLISKTALSKCEILINKIRSENNSLLESNEDNDDVRGMINVIKQNAQYAYEVIHAIVHKTDLKSVRAPFISENNKENVDNYDPRWEALRQLETDEERYKAVRKRWLNLGIPDPHSNVTYRTRRYPCLQNNNTFNPLGNESRTEYYEVFFETKAKNMQDNYDRLLANLNWNEKADTDSLFMKHKQEQDDLLRNCHRNMYLRQFRNLYNSHMQETRMLKADYGHQRRALFSNLQSMQDSLRSEKRDAYSFLKFYDGLNGQKSLKMSKTEVQEALEIDDMISKYEEFYKG